MGGDEATCCLIRLVGVLWALPSADVLQVVDALVLEELLDGRPFKVMLLGRHR